ncbi:DNA polymerase III subunit delta' [Mycoplasmopsis arginini]|uniref:DNA polymerase III n=1 Tax=Mycoplasmopsis arginini TaxID=2094 RepID=UPI000A27BFCE|nr:DNA polymerase III [Mycoplasmopsis arginini]SGA03094.1 DNA polymerase III subunit delta' [Chlamydia abortus]PWC08746.1 DNA polymerase III [Mycoplasmopsis arginini]SGA08467.1 DNA polymerase III subunit delta' [Mycoplasmopsis arginini]SGA30426.1 DNA polymerase III subunit delta' [Mycoplasmopsis arginini]SGA31935.1 DNA polymerase III subunit delta' [Chlamydia abortus]
MIDSVFKNIIDNSLKENKLSQVYLLSSKNIKSFDEYFLYFISKVNHDNFKKFSDIKFGELYFYIDGQNQTINKQTILDSMNETTETSILFKNKKKILFISNIENGTQHSLNSLLKFLENPPYNTIIIMSCNFISQVIKTIKSRAFIIEINHKNDETKIDKSKPFASFFKTINTQYNEELIYIFNDLSKSISLSYKNPLLFLQSLIINFNYENKEIILNFLIMAFMDIYKIKKGIKELDIFNDFKFKQEAFDYIPIYKIISLLKEVKNNINNAANFNLQKSNLLLKLEEFYGI